ncbi:hypothetical protein, partial [Moorena sp. SIO3H5]|uniref:hypothetical protein n=1 Tax=Moorena sp. SIO3H5 TaxID=2607834 RepID=UPI0013B7C89F
MKSNPLPQKHLSSPQPIQEDIDQGVEQQPQDSLPELETETARQVSSNTPAHPSLPQKATDVAFYSAWYRYSRIGCDRFQTVP